MLGRRFRLAAILGALALCLSCGGGSSVAYKEGRKAESRKDWDSALVNYQKALQSDPANAAYVLHESQARTQASIFHLKNARKLLEEGRTEAAAGELQKATSIDPSNQAATQELARILTKQAEAKRAREAGIQQALKSREEAGRAPTVQLQPFPAEPLAHFRINADSRKILETLGKLAGLNVVFTADFRPSPLTVDLTNIKVEDALNVVALQSKSFWRAVTPNTILFVPDDPNHRRDYDEEVLKTIYLSNPLAPADRTAITTALKQVLGLQRIMDNPDSNAIIIRDTPAKVAAAEQLVHDLDRGKAEILLDIDVVEADRDRINDLGLSPATVSSSGTITPGITGGALFSPPTTSHFGISDYTAVLPSVEATAILNDSKTRILQSPQVRVTDGQTAKLKIGTRIPYATGSFLPSLTTTSTTSSSTLLASTQFQYQDVGVNLDLTPRLLVTGEVAVHAKIEISSLGAPISVGGISEPTFGQRVIEHDIRLREGEVSLLGGLIQTTTTESVQGIPGLGDIPLLHYLFSQTSKEVNNQEVLVMLTPQVIRLPERGVSVGTNLPVGEGGGAAGRPGVPEPQQTPEVSPESPPEHPPTPPGQPQ